MCNKLQVHEFFFFFKNRFIRIKFILIKYWELITKYYRTPFCYLFPHKFLSLFIYIYIFMYKYGHHMTASVPIYP